MNSVSPHNQGSGGLAGRTGLPGMESNSQSSTPTHYSSNRAFPRALRRGAGPLCITLWSPSPVHFKPEETQNAGEETRYPQPVLSWSTLLCLTVEIKYYMYWTSGKTLSLFDVHCYNFISMKMLILSDKADFILEILEKRQPSGNIMHPHTPALQTKPSEVCHTLDFGHITQHLYLKRLWWNHLTRVDPGCQGVQLHMPEALSSLHLFLLAPLQNRWGC